MTYTELKAAIIAYTENQSFTATNLATFTKQAEQRIYNSVQIANLRKNVTGSLTAGNKYLSCPTDYLSSYSLAVYPFVTTTATGTSGQTTITVASASGIVVGQYVSGSNIGTEAIVSLINGTTITLTVANSGTVNGTVTFQGDYTYLLNKDVNFIREVYPNPREYGALVEAYTFMKGEQDMMVLYDTKYKEALMLLKNLGDGKQRGDAYRDGQVKLPVR